MTTKIVIRILDEAGQLLGWTEVQARMRDGALWPPTAIMPVPIHVTGRGRWLSLHWADLNVEVRFGLDVVVTAGDTMPLDYTGREMIRVGPPASGLPAVTVGRPIQVAVPSGGMGTRVQ